MRRTRKFLAAKARIRELGLRPGRRYENADIYQLLENHKQIWDHKKGEWVEGTKSMFGDDEPSGIVRLRVMAHPADVNHALHMIKDSRLSVVEISDEYPNRNGVGVRVYLTCKIEVKS